MHAVNASVRELASWLASWTWPMTREHALDTAEQFGWVLADDQPDSLLWDTGLPPGSSATVLGDVVADVAVRTSERVSADADGRRVLRDVFADQVQAVSSVLGEPAAREPGQRPSATWDLDGGATLTVGLSARSSSWTLTSPKFVEIQRDLGRDR